MYEGAHREDPADSKQNKRIRQELALNSEADFRGRVQSPGRSRARRAERAEAVRKQTAGQLLQLDHGGRSEDSAAGSDEEK